MVFKELVHYLLEKPPSVMERELIILMEIKILYLLTNIIAQHAFSIKKVTDFQKDIILALIEMS